MRNTSNIEDYMSQVKKVSKTNKKALPVDKNSGSIKSRPKKLHALDSLALELMKSSIDDDDSDGEE